MKEKRFLDVPGLGLGTWKLTGQTCADRVREALELGYRHIDTAQMYENEEEVGRGMKESDTPREDVFLTTKLWFDELKGPDVAPSTEASLKRLGTDYVDLLLIHWPNEDVPLEETLAAMMKLQEQGKVSFIGVSNFTVGLWKRALERAPVNVNQVEYHPFLNQQPLLDLARERSAYIIAYSPLARGEVLEDPTLKEIAERYRKSPAQIALRWLLQQDGVAAAIPKAAKSEHLRENRDIFDFELEASDLVRISDLRGSERMVDPAWAPWR